MLPSGGGIRVAHQLARGLKNHFQVKLYRPEGGSSAGTDSQITESVIPYPIWQRPSGALKAIAPAFLMLRLACFHKVCREAAKKINREADMVLVHNTMPVAAPPLFRHLTIPSLYFCYEYPRHIYEKDIISRTDSRFREALLSPLEKLERKMDLDSVSNADNLVTFSRWMKQQMQTIYHRSAKIVRPGINTDFFTPDQSAEREGYALSVGALWPFKGHETAVRILAGIEEVRRPGLVIVADRGYPGYREKLISLAESLAVTVTIRESISDEILRELYRKAEFVFCCQRREPYGLVPLEAMACKTPVIAIAEGGFMDNIVHGETGVLFDGTVTDGTSFLAGMLSDRTRTSSVAERGLHFVRKERNLDSGVKQIAEVIGKL